MSSNHSQDLLYFQFSVYLGATVSILDFFIAVVVDVPYIIKSSTENTRQERTKQYREQLDSEKALQDQKTIFGRAALVVRGKRMTDGRINEKLDKDEQNDPMSNCYRDFKNKLQKVDGDFRPFRSSEMHEILCLVIIQVGFLKIENKNLVIIVVEEL